jgi:hypothetical protein
MAKLDPLVYERLSGIVAWHIGAVPHRQQGILL